MKIGVSLGLAVALLALAWPAHSADPTRDPASNGVTGPELLARVRVANELLYSDLQNFVCNERIDRYKGLLGGTAVRRIDTVTSKVSFENGTEHYTDIRQNDRPRPHISSLSGAWSEGEFGTLLRQTQALLESKSVLSRMDTDLQGVPAVLYRLEVSEQDSPWDLEVDSSSYHIPFRTGVWVSRSSGQILEIERRSTGVPLESGISEVRWSVSLESIELNGKNWLLPKHGEYEVSYRESNRREWNLLSFSDYHRYGSEVTLSFDGK